MIIENNKIKIENITDVKQFDEIQYYTTTISIRELSEVYHRLTYDGEAQRGSIEGNPMIDQKHVKSIYENLINGNSIRGHLTWNLRKTEKETGFSFNDELREIIVENNQLITIPDSAHRHEAFMMASSMVEDDSVLDSRFSLDIYNLSIEDEKEFFSTVNGKVKAPNRNRTLFLSNDIECKLLRDVIINSNLNSKIECVRASSAKDGKLTKFSTLYDSLFGASGSFDKGSVTDENYKEYVEWLIDFYNELLASRHEFKISTSDEKVRLKQDSMVLEEISWWGYGYMAHLLKGERKWKYLLKEKINKMINVEGGSPIHFLSKSNPIWHATVIKPKYNFITKTQEIGTSVSNSNTTRASVKKIFYITLF